MVNTFSAMGGFSFMILNLFDPPCIAAIGTIMREMGSKFWGWFAVLYQMVLGYISYDHLSVRFMVILWGNIRFGQILSIVCILVMIYFIVRPAPKPELKTQRA